MGSLDILLHSYFTNDERVVQHLPAIIDSLEPSNFGSTAQNSKWTNRINALLHAKQPASRWAGLVLAHHTSLHSKDIMVDQAQSWLAIALPIISRREAAPCQSAAIRLLCYVCAKAREMRDFQRQVVLPIVPKFSAAMIALTEASTDNHFKELIFVTLGNLIRAYPTAHRALHQSLATLCRKFLLHHDLLPAVVDLYATLPLTFGKTAAASQWRAVLDENIQEVRKLHKELRKLYAEFARVPSNILPVDSISNLFIKLRAHAAIIYGLLYSPLPRHATLPLGDLIGLGLELIKSVKGSAGEEQSLDLDLLAVSELWSMGCRLLSKLISCSPSTLTPYLHIILTTICSQLETGPSLSLKLALMELVHVLLEQCPCPHDSVLLGRLLRNALPEVNSLLNTKKEIQNSAEQETTSRQRKKKGNNFAEDIVSQEGSFLLTSSEQGQLVLVVLNVISNLLAAPGAPASIKSLAFRILLYLSFRLPAIAAQPGTLEMDYLPQIARSVQVILSNTIHRSSKFATNAQELGAHAALIVDGTNMKQILAGFEAAIHPSVPPLVGMPSIQALTLSRNEEGEEERRMRNLLHVDAIEMEPTTKTIQQQSTEGSQRAHVKEVEPISYAPSPPPPVTNLTGPPSAPVSTSGVEERLFSTERLEDTTKTHTSAATEEHSSIQSSKNVAAVPSSMQPVDTIPRAKAPDVSMDEDDDESLPEINMESSDEEEGEE